MLHNILLKRVMLTVIRPSLCFKESGLKIWIAFSSTQWLLELLEGFVKIHCWVGLTFKVSDLVGLGLSSRNF